jgi:ABC-type glutathione transport system ATPase component
VSGREPPRARPAAPPDGGRGPLLSARNLQKSFSAPGGQEIRAVAGVDLDLAERETFAIVGESGCGKTTLARLLIRLIEPDAGTISFCGVDWLAVRGAELRRRRRHMQMIFQDPFASLDPRMAVEKILSEPLEIHEPELDRQARRARLLEILEAVGLGADLLGRFPHEFSGGQRQRLAIARALVLRPRLVVADEPVSALDVSIGAQVLALLARLGSEFGLTYLLISHSLPIVAQLASRIAVMREGRFVEAGPAEKILNRPEHPYTRALLAAVPVLPSAS